MVNTAEPSTKAHNIYEISFYYREKFRGNKVSRTIIASLQIILWSTRKVLQYTKKQSCVYPRNVPISQRTKYLGSSSPNAY